MRCGLKGISLSVYKQLVRRQVLLLNTRHYQLLLAVVDIIMENTMGNTKLRVDYYPWSAITAKRFTLMEINVIYYPWRFTLMRNTK